MISLLSSCSFIENRRKNLLFECQFSCELNELNYFLEIKKISKEEFENAEGLNVVSEHFSNVWNHKYYSINFHSSFAKDPNAEVFERINFANLEAVQGKRTVKVNYENNHCLLSPRLNYDGYKHAYYIYVKSFQSFWMYRDVLGVYK